MAAPSQLDYTVRQEIWQMKIVVSAQRGTLDAPTSPVFGRCEVFVVVDGDTMDFEALPNPAASQSGGAGIQAAQLVVNQGAEVVLTGNLGPNAFDVLQAAGVPAYLVQGGTVRQAVEAYQAGERQPLGKPSVMAHAGIGGGGRGLGRGRGSGLGAGAGSGAGSPARAEAQTEQDQLKQTVQSLRQQMADVMEAIDRLEKED
jgi:predicted Fe-Mo cluster-binding NifX family protein